MWFILVVAVWLGCIKYYFGWVGMSGVGGALFWMDEGDWENTLGRWVLVWVSGVGYAV